MAAPEVFGETYAEVRGRFLDLASARGALVRTLGHPSERGAQGEPLAMDVATFGDPQAERTLLLVSGTHGQEGFTGSAIQIAFLKDLTPPPGANVVVLHALNPWGFSHGSRTDEANVDLNRNFRDFASPLPENPFYGELHADLCPDAWTDETIDWIPARDRLVEQHGWPKVLTGMTGGQFEEPTGLNYGGRSAAWSHRAAAELLPEAMSRSRRVAFVEWHTGLGAYGELCHICLHAPGSPEHTRVFDWMGQGARDTLAASFDGAAGATPSYEGLFNTWLPKALPWAECAGLAIEVGTYDNVRVMNSLRLDRWLKFGRGESKASREDLRRWMMEGLYPSDPAWRARAIANGCLAQQSALEGLLRW